MNKLIGGHLYNVSDSNFDDAHNLLIDTVGPECSKIIWPTDGCDAWCADDTSPWLQVVSMLHLNLAYGIYVYWMPDIDGLVL